MPVVRERADSVYSTYTTQETRRKSTRGSTFSDGPVKRESTSSGASSGPAESNLSTGSRRKGGRLSKQQKPSLLKRCLQIPSCLCYGASHVLVLWIFVLQMGVMDYILIIHEIRLAFLFIVFEVPLGLHMISHCGSYQGLKSSSLQWIVYCWLFSAKTLILYFQVCPELGGGTTMRSIASIMVLSPLFYMLLTFRTLRQLFDKADPTAASSGPGRPRRGHVTLDIVLLQDMLWHVVIDMIDMINMMFLAIPDDAKDGIGLTLVSKFPSEVAVISKCAGVFIFLGFLFHQQSFPSIGIAGPVGGITTSRGAVGPSSTSGTGSNLTLATREESGISYLQRTVRVAFEDPTAEVVEQEGNIDVVKARKRSAMISILLVDLPFFILRTYIYSLTLSSISGDQLLEADQTPGMRPVGSLHSDPTIEIEATKKPELDKWWIKNALCLVLQAMQLRFVQQAEMEQSQNLQLQDSHQAAVYRKIRKRRRMPQDINLKRAWKEVDEEKASVVAAVALASDNLHISPHGEGTLRPPLPIDSSGPANAAMSSGGSLSQMSPSSLEAGSGQPAAEDAEDAENEELEESVGRSRSKSCSGRCYWSLRKCCCGRRRRCYPSSMMLHALIGLAAGWLIAKQDFHHSQEMLLHSMGKKNAEL